MSRRAAGLRGARDTPSTIAAAFSHVDHPSHAKAIGDPGLPRSPSKDSSNGALEIDTRGSQGGAD
jgi:hypothetical protein